MAERKGWALVTGASGGIGLELARLIAADGYDLVLVARSARKLEEVAAQLGGRHGVRARPLVADLARPQAPGEILAFLRAEAIEVELLANNAGYGNSGPFAETDPRYELEMIQVNVVALTELSKLLLPGMLARRSGRVLNVASTAAFQPGPLMAVYYATKAFVLSLSEALANEVAGSGVSVTALCPGPSPTGFQAAAHIEGGALAKSPLAVDPVTVARIGYAGLKRGRPLVIPGLLNRLLVQALRVSPRRFVVAMVRRLQDQRR
jgi:uncharacterized protein